MDNESLIERLVKVEQALKSAQHQINELKDLVETIRDLAAGINYMRSDLDKMKDDIDTIKDKPTKRYELIVTGIISALTSGIITFVISSILH